MKVSNRVRVKASDATGTITAPASSRQPYVAFLVHLDGTPQASNLLFYVEELEDIPAVTRFDLRGDDEHVKKAVSPSDLRADKDVLVIENDSDDPASFDRGNNVFDYLATWRSSTTSDIVCGTLDPPARLFVRLYGEGASRRPEFIFGEWKRTEGTAYLVYYGG